MYKRQVYDRAASARCKGRAGNAAFFSYRAHRWRWELLAYLLSRRVTRSECPVCAHASVKYTEALFAGSDKFPTKEVVRGVPATAAEGGPTHYTAMGVASLDSAGLYPVKYHGHRLIWALAVADSLKKRLLVCAHLEGTGHRGVDAAMARLGRHCVWDRGKTCRTLR